MEQFIGCDAHKKFSVFVAVNEKGHAGEALRVAHDRQLYREFLARLPAHSAIAVEASGSYSWLVDERSGRVTSPGYATCFAIFRRSTMPRKPDSRANCGVISGKPIGSMESISISPSSIGYRAPTLTWGRVQIRTLQVIFR
jgi:hypothetical protein